MWRWYWSFLLTALNSIYLLLIIWTTYRIKIRSKEAITFLTLGTLFSGLATGALVYTSWVFSVNFIIYILIITYIFRMKLIQVVNILLLYYVLISTGSLINYYYFIKHLGYSIINVINVPWIFIQSNIIILLSVIFYSFIIFILPRQKKFMQVFNLSSKGFSNIYLSATYLSISVSFTLLFNKAFYDNGLKLNTVIISIIFVLTSIIFMFTNYQLISKSKENNELKTLIDTISMLNKKLQDELSERKKVEEKLKLYATLDIMTGVYNRATGLDILKDIIEKAKGNEKSIVLCYTDVNNLKLVNDNYGHNEGDILITTIVQVLKKYIEEPNIIIRLGGDEFLIVLYDITLANAHNVIKKVYEELDYLNASKKKPYIYSISRGIIEYSPKLLGEVSINDLILKADDEMYKHKKGIG